MAHLALQDIEMVAVVVIDPKGDLAADFASRYPEPAWKRWSFSMPLMKPVGINPLVGARIRDLAADVLLGVMHSLYADPGAHVHPRHPHACLLTLARRGDASLVMGAVRPTPASGARSPGRSPRAIRMGLGAFWAWFEAMSDGERQQGLSRPLMNKLRPILLRPQLRVRSASVVHAST